MEGAGEVQTPLKVGGGGSQKHRVTLDVGDPVFFRHAKAGELAEHVNEYLLVRGDKIVDRVHTYRGMGRCFLG
jgi:D-serine deaminase-like pyridoxal phosphate-dependent protein